MQTYTLMVYYCTYCFTYNEIVKETKWDETRNKRKHNLGKKLVYLRVCWRKINLFRKVGSNLLIHDEEVRPDIHIGTGEENLTVCLYGMDDILIT